MAGQQIVQSFVLRFVKDENIPEQWRIRITDVQGEKEIVMTQLAEAVAYIEEVLARISK
ncbi:hypothetical protein [Rubeoparvulum massiliense]|uniref:hypothetical protein n=1 Tax=Rubeoparvulum massiliense TaxID=1631346 RepID=UPI0012E0C18F|nr:hypothetical protein [Rubeoparvulum massiliense]